jgi:hypothetical protein
MLIQSGTTQDGRTVVRGVYRLYETEGLPLDVILDALIAHNSIPDWTAFVIEAELAGMKLDRILSKLDAAIVDTYGSTMRDVVIHRLSV